MGPSRMGPNTTPMRMAHLQDMWVRQTVPQVLTAYDMDDEDEAWLAKFSKVNSGARWIPAKPYLPPTGCLEADVTYRHFCGSSHSIGECFSFAFCCAWLGGLYSLPVTTGTSRIMRSYGCRCYACSCGARCHK